MLSDRKATSFSRKSLRSFLAVFLLLYTLSFLYVWTTRVPAQRFAFVTLGLTAKYDLLCFVERYKVFGTPAFYGLEGQPFNYPAFAAILLRPFYGASIPPDTRYALSFLAVTLVSSCIFVASMTRRGMPTHIATALAACATFSFPTLLMAYLYNAEMLVWIFLTVGVWACCKKYFWIAALCFGLGAALKYYPILLLVIFLRRGQWSKAAAGVAAAVLASLLSLIWLGPTLPAAYAGLRSQLPRFAAYYLQTWHVSEGSIDHSLYGYVKLIAVQRGHPEILKWTLPVYLFAMALSASALYFARIRKQPMLNQLLAYMVICVWLSPLSADYTLVNLIPVMGALVSYAWGHSQPGDDKLLVPAFVCFAILLAPIYFITIAGIPYQGPIRSAVLGVLFSLTLRHDLAGESVIDPSPSQYSRVITV